MNTDELKVGDLVGCIPSSHHHQMTMHPEAVMGEVVKITKTTVQVDNGTGIVIYTRNGKKRGETYSWGSSPACIEPLEVMMRFNEDVRRQNRRIKVNDTISKKLEAINKLWRSSPSTKRLEALAKELEAIDTTIPESKEDDES